MSIEMTDESAPVVVTDARVAMVIVTHEEKTSIVEEEARTPQIVNLETA